MAIRLESEYMTGLILAADMADGDVGVIVDGGSYTNTVVQMFRNHLICLGKPYGKSWSEGRHTNFKIKILENGTRLIVDNNVT